MTAAAPTYRLAADCPKCDATLTLRRAKASGESFVGCSAYPGCKFTEPHDPRVDALVETLDELLERARTTQWPSRQAFADDVAARLAALRGPA